MRSTTLRPAIVIGETDHEQLLELAGGSSAPAAETLLMEMERARVVPDKKLPADVVRIGSRVRYATDKDESIEVTVVFPIDANISEGRISVLTPVGAALIGLREGQAITWESRDGRKNVLRVISVEQGAFEAAKA